MGFDGRESGDMPVVDEVERLRAELSAYEKRHQEFLVECSEQRKRNSNLRAANDALRAELSERDELLREARAWIVEGKVDFDDSLATRIDAALKGTSK